MGVRFLMDKIDCILFRTRVITIQFCFFFQLLCTSIANFTNNKDIMKELHFTFALHVPFFLKRSNELTLRKCKCAHPKCNYCSSHLVASSETWEFFRKNKTITNNQTQNLHWTMNIPTRFLMRN